MIVASWNINGIKSLLTHDISLLKSYNIDVLLVQEVRTGNIQLLYQLASVFEFPYVFYNLSRKTGHAGVAIMSKIPSQDQFYPDHIIPEEGRILVIQIADFYIVNLYAPYIGTNLANLDKRKLWEENVKTFLLQLKRTGTRLIVGGDLNVAPEARDRLRVCKSQPGCSDEESNMFKDLLESVQLRDAYRELYETDGYTWGIHEGRLRIDFFLVDKVADIEISNCYPVYELHKLTNPSDHYPLVLSINLKS